MKLPPILLFVSSLLTADYVRAQPTVKSTPLHRFLQQHYDSTSIYHSGSSWNNSPNYLILAKHQNQVDFFTYTSPYRGIKGRYYPGQLARKFAREDHAFRAAAPDTNRYLQPQPARPAALQQAWQQLDARQLWRVKDDQETISKPGTCVVEDADDNVFYLIDRRTIRVASFYAPDLQQCLGPDSGRRHALAARKILRALLTSRPQ
ncbi:hypothetical protein [Hymenobacter chitinivorans]|uniref:Uncharacterized protein n=1 Tax=Hymenobacter chitinivorans DSM 11115 TaxID=1121954 RepID=A0A2M9ARV9_9BACT|nr:hypothetical protein [Hymenobacter chitinivorans]PJJ48432.1 hypothetical protein CLV45_4139 [Hymenobacter chitinivorans DSM 11115]